MQKKPSDGLTFCVTDAERAVITRAAALAGQLGEIVRVGLAINGILSIEEPHALEVASRQIQGVIINAFQMHHAFKEALKRPKNRSATIGRRSAFPKKRRYHGRRPSKRKGALLFALQQDVSAPDFLVTRGKLAVFCLYLRPQKGDFSEQDGLHGTGIFPVVFRSVICRAYCSRAGKSGSIPGKDG